MATLKLRKKHSKKSSKKSITGKKAPAKKTGRSKKASGERKHTVAPFAAETMFKHRTASPREIARIVRKEFPKCAKRWDDPEFIMDYAGMLNRGTARIQRQELVGMPPKKIALVGMAKAS